MPFTLAHPAAALPLRRLCPGVFVWSGLLIGTMTPDLECFLTLRPEARHGVTFLGSLYFCVPAGLVVFGLFHGLVRRPGALLLPRAWREVVWPIAEPRFRPTIRNLVSLAVSILVGAWLHQVWDAFTHAGYWGVENFPALAVTVLEIHGYELTGFRLLQHGSTLFGAVCLAVAVGRWKTRCRPRPAPELKEPARVAFLCLIVAASAWPAVVRGLDKASPFAGVEYARQFVGFGVISAISYGSLALLLVGIVVTMSWDRWVEAGEEGQV